MSGKVSTTPRWGGGIQRVLSDLQPPLKNSQLLPKSGNFNLSPTYFDALRGFKDTLLDTGKQSNKLRFASNVVQKLCDLH